MKVAARGLGSNPVETGVRETRFLKGFASMELMREKKWCFAELVRTRFALRALAGKLLSSELETLRLRSE